MATQPANTDINVFRRTRGFRQAHRHESIGSLIKRLRPLVMSVPAEEVLVTYQNRDTFASVAGTSGKSFDFPIQIGQDKFLKLTTAGLTHATNSDLHASVRAVAGTLSTHI